MPIIERQSKEQERKLLKSYHLALNWVKRNTISGKGIAVTDLQPSHPYPEVSGYFIPTLLNCGERDLALQYGRWLASIQNPDGSWNEWTGKTPYTFDTGQVVRGLLSLSPVYPEFDRSIIRGCDWILKQEGPHGGLTTPSKKHWILRGNEMIPENIHLYVLPALYHAGVLFKRPDYILGVERLRLYYKKYSNPLAFKTLSHFYAYAIDALFDLGDVTSARTAMKHIAKLQCCIGCVPAYHDSSWTCSSGSAQCAVLWYKLGMTGPADLALDHLISIQNKSGGFFGSYGRGADYLPSQETSWAVKYFLDACHWKIRSTVDIRSSV